MHAAYIVPGFLIRDLDELDLEKVAGLHKHAFPEYFLTNLGDKFLQRYYAQFIGSPRDRGVVATDASGIVGFCVGTEDRASLFSRLYRARFASTALLVAGKTIVNPVIRKGLLARFEQIRFAFQARFGVRRPSLQNGDRMHTPSARLLSVAVDTKHMGTGLAVDLVESFCARLYAAGVTDVGLTVAPSNGRAIAFYVKTGWQEVFANPSQCGFRRATKPREARVKGRL